MPRNDYDFHERDPHSDGRYENIINDSTAKASEQMGIKMDIDPENIGQPNNPFHMRPKVDKEMQKFAAFFEGENPKKSGE